MIFNVSKKIIASRIHTTGDNTNNDNDSLNDETEGLLAKEEDAGKKNCLNFFNICPRKEKQQ